MADRTIPPPRNGSVIHYAYLWRAEQDRGLLEAAKNRPAAVILTHRETAAGPIQVFVLPITHRPPKNPSESIEIPAQVKARLGLDGERSWIVCNELNRFRWPGPNLRPIPGRNPRRWEYGLLPPNLYQRAKELFLAIRAKGRLADVDRD